MGIHLVIFIEIIPLLMGSLTTAAFAQQCQGGMEGQLGTVIFTSPSAFNGIASSLQGCAGFATNAMSCGGTSVIIDGNSGPTAPNLTSANDVRMFFTWQSQSSEDILIVLGLAERSTISSIELYFLSYPTQHIGLPSIQLFEIPSMDQGTFLSLTSGTPINYAFSDVFVSKENMINKVTLFNLSNPGPHGALRLQISFNGVDNIDWFFLSEVNICTGTIPSQSTSYGERVVLESSSGTPTSVVLNCTVLGAGMFEWQWKRDNATLQSGGRYHITVADGTRTSRLNISQLRLTDAGNYTCEVRHQSQSSYQSRTQELVLPGGEERATQVTVVPGSQSTGGTLGTGETLGTGGTRATGVTSTAGVTGGTTTPAGGPTDNSTSVGGSNGGVIAAAVILVLLFIGVLVAIVIVLVVFLRWHKTRATKSDLRTQNGNGTTNLPMSDSSPRKYTVNDIEWQIEPQIYSAVQKELPPAIPPQNFDVSELYNMEYEEHNLKPERRMTALSQYSYSGPPKLAKVTNQKTFSLSPNPIYQSNEDLPDGSYKNTPDELNIYAEPLQARRLTSNATSASSEPIYSEALDPNLLFSQDTGARGGNDLHPYSAIYADPQPLKRSEAPFQITASNIRKLKRLGIGQFGEVVLAETVGVSLKDFKMGNDDSKDIHIQVAVKKLKPKAQSSVRESFEKEIKFMSRLKDENIVCLLAICTSGSPFIVMEYMENGDLNQYLQKYELATSESSANLPNQLPSSILVYMVVQIASGMRYLASLKYVHRDMATRNCLVGRDYVVKIADFGMSRSLYEDSYYRVRGRAMLPIRWMASESFYGRFSEKTDVWAYGVTMWEIFTLCKQQPYEELDDQEVIQDAIRGVSRQLLPRPEGCSQELYEVMLRCWEYVPDERADFEEIFSTLSAIHRYM